MSEECEVADLFVEEVPEAVKNAPKHHYVEVKRPNGLGKVNLRMVKRHVLWGDHLWNAGQWLAAYFDEHPEEVRGKSVVELGAGAGLPSIIAALQGATLTCVTDYPDPELIDNLVWNIEENVKDSALKGKIQAKGFLWGAPVDEIVELNGGKKFDIVILCDLLFNHSEHTKLAKSTLEFLAPGGVVWCVFTHYIPDRVQKDLKFLELAKDTGLEGTCLGQHRFSHLIFENDRGDPDVRRTCHIYQFRSALE